MCYVYREQAYHTRRTSRSKVVTKTIEKNYQSAIKFERRNSINLYVNFWAGILSTFTIALLTPARGGKRCESVCSAVHRLTIPLELVWNQPYLSLWKYSMTLPSLLRNLIMHSSFLMSSPRMIAFRSFFARAYIIAYKMCAHVYR